MFTRSFASALLLAACVALTSCGSTSDEPVETADTAATTAGVDSVSVTSRHDRPPIDPVVDGELVLPDGWFELAGYGTVLHVDGDTAVPHYVTASTCTTGYPIANTFDVDHATDDGTIIMDIVGTTTDYRLVELADGLESCDSSADDSLTALDELFGAHYPFFDERTTDWPMALADISVAVEGDPSIFAEALGDFMLALGDGHTTFEDLDVDLQYDKFAVPGIETMDDVVALIDAEIASTIDRLEHLEFDETGTVGWGHLTDGSGVGHSSGGIGYLYIDSFEGLTSTGDPVDDRDAMATALDTAVSELAGRYDSMIVDVRFNPGGHEDLAVMAAGYFVDNETSAYTKRAFAQPDPVVQTIEVTPAEVGFDGDLVVLTSPVTASAAEAFVLTVRETADAVLVGSPSFGEFSDAIDWQLPNGIEFTLSMEIYTDLAGNNFEAVGVPVDIASPFDMAFEAAIESIAAAR